MSLPLPLPLSGTSGGGTKHRVKRNRRRTVKAAATYGAAYRKYNRMYGGATDDPAPPGMWERLKNYVTKNNDNNEDAEKQKQAQEPEEPGLFAKANAKVQETVKETVATAENVASTAETALQNTKDRVSKAADAVKQTASAVGTTLETSGALVKNQIGSAIDTIDAADKDAAKTDNVNAEESNDNVVEEKKPDAADTPDADASESSGEMEMTDDKRRIKELEERIRKMTSGTIAKAIEAAEQATGSVEDALKALQLAFIASKTVIAAGKAALVANSGNDEEAVLSQGADVESQPQPEPASADTEPVAEQEQEVPVKDEGDSDASDSSSVSSDSDASSETSSDDGAVPAAEPEPEQNAAAQAETGAEASSEPVVKDDIPPETVEPQTGETAQQPQTDASKAADTLNSETDNNKKMGGKKHKHKTKNSAVVNNRTRRH
jgi:hypothetical protein